jgi:hypothetical protein
MRHFIFLERTMTPADWYEIECIDGASATIYLNGGLPPSVVAEIRDACDALPLSIRILRVQLMVATDVDAPGARVVAKVCAGCASGTGGHVPRHVVPSQRSRNAG